MKRGWKIKAFPIVTKKVIIDGNVGIRIYGLPGLQTYELIIIAKGNYIYTISFITSDPDKDFHIVSDQILQTFKFTK